MAIADLLGRQNPDGGWPYQTGISWTEPTVYALLAAFATGAGQGAVRRGLDWLRRHQRPDGGWPPQPGVTESTWVTTLVALLPPAALGERYHSQAVSWLVRVSGEETSAVFRLRQFLLGNSIPEDQRFRGWPWYPGTAAWVTPTSLAILALEKAWRRTGAPRILERVDWGRRFLLARMCREGGWNHGGARALGIEGLPYPETTGVALLALRGVRAPHVGRALAAAEGFLGQCRSTEGLSWLRLGLLAHGRNPDRCPAPAPRCRNLRDQALTCLADAAAGGRNVFWD